MKQSQHRFSQGRRAHRIVIHQGGDERGCDAQVLVLWSQLGALRQVTVYLFPRAALTNGHTWGGVRFKQHLTLLRFWRPDLEIGRTRPPSSLLLPASGGLLAVLGF